MEKIIAFDKNLLIYLNNLGSPAWDNFWLLITKQLHWSLFFIVVFYFLMKKIGWKQFGFVVLFLALLILVTDQLTNFSKFTFQRLRPCSDPTIQNAIRIVQERSSFSFFSGHASNSMASTTFFFLIFRKHYRYAFLLFAFPLIFAYSRIYLGLHFPIDILVGFMVGVFNGTLFYKLYGYFQKRYFPIL